jgi:hypothetical protein
VDPVSSSSANVFNARLDLALAVGRQSLTRPGVERGVVSACWSLVGGRILAFAAVRLIAWANVIMGTVSHRTYSPAPHPFKTHSPRTAAHAIHYWYFSSLPPIPITLARQLLNDIMQRLMMVKSHRPAIPLPQYR